MIDHYATSYGLLGSLVNFHPFIISAWGSDIFDFPKKSFLHAWLLRRNLKSADAIFSTSMIMKEEIKKYTNTDPVLTPFGIDTTIFHKMNVAPRREITVGINKSMPYCFSIDLIIPTVISLLGATFIL